MAGHAQSSAGAASGRPAWCWALLAALLWAGGSSAETPVVIVERVPKELLRFELVQVPGGRVSVDDPAHPGERVAVDVRPFYMTRHEVRWDEFGWWLYRETFNRDPETSIQPTEVMVTPDQGYGTEGFPAITVNANLAAAYCRWLTAGTGHRYRLPTEAEWLWACLAGEPERVWAPAELDAVAWYGGTMVNPTRLPEGPGPMPVGTKQPNRYGLYDMLGNVSEWCVRLDGTTITAGGSWRDPADQVHPRARVPFNPAWQRSQRLRKANNYWLWDAPWVGLRVVREMDPPQP